MRKNNVWRKKLTKVLVVVLQQPHVTNEFTLQELSRDRILLDSPNLEGSQPLGSTLDHLLNGDDESGWCL